MGDSDIEMATRTATPGRARLASAAAPDAAREAPVEASARRLPRSSKPFLAEDHLATRWDAGQPMRPEASVAEAIARFERRHVPSDQWARIEPVVRAAVEAAAPTTLYRAQELLNVTAQLASWADTTGQATDPAVLFHPDTIERFVTKGCAHLARGTQFNYRRELRVVGAAVLGEPLYPPRQIPLSRDDLSRPYTEPELAALIAQCRGLPTPFLRENAKAIVALGLGAGLSAQEISWARGTDVTVDDRGVLMAVRGPRPRVVPVLDEWAEAVASRAEVVGPRPLLLPDRSEIKKYQLSNFLERWPKGGPKADTRRLRATWIVGHLERGTHVLALADAAGVNPNYLGRFFRFVARLDPQEARRQLHRSRR
jgi:integrase